MHRIFATATTLLIVLGSALVAAPASADHTDPTKPLAPTDGAIEEGIERGDGTWEHLANFPGIGGPQLTGGGTDLEFFRAAGSKDIWGSFGTLGQDAAGSIGQRLIRLTTNGEVDPTWQADHGSAHCETQNSSVTGLQHDTQAAQMNGVTLLTDTTDASGRCHDTGGGGIEIVDATDVARPTEVHLIRFPGFTHTNTVDDRRPWIVYSSSSDFADRNWIDVVNMRSCFGDKRTTAKQRRTQCRPEVSRIQLQDAWTQQRDQTTGELEPGSATCHDITYRDNRLYCAALNATLILDVSNLTGRGGKVTGSSLPCPVVDGTRTGAKVTDCSGMGRDRTERATGWRFLGTYQHPGRDCGPPGSDVRNCNSNLHVRSDEGVSVSHEADPTPDEQFMFVTDERGGGIVPPGSSCSPGIENPYGNGGAHAFDISDPSNIDYATTPEGEKAVYISDAVVPASTFCDIHVIEQIPGEQRLIAAYYSQGIKIVDYYVDDAGHLQFVERSSFTLPRANTWAAEDFKIRSNADGTRTYYIAVDDIHRGIDVVSWTGKPNPMGSPPPASSDTLTNAGLVGASAVMLGAAAFYRRRRHATGH